MTKRKWGQKETRSEFLRTALGTNPELDLPQVNRLWAKTGHAGEISSSLYSQVRAKMGIKTAWAWVKEPKKAADEAAVTAAGRKKSDNGDLVEVAESLLPHILMFYQRFKDKRPVMLLDLPSGKIYAFPYEEFKADLSPPSQDMLTADYEKALAGNKVVVFVRDNEARRLASMLFDGE